MENENNSKLTIGNLRNNNDIKSDLDDIASFEVEIKEYNEKIDVELKTYDLLDKSDFEKLKKYFSKYNYEFQSVYAVENDLILNYELIGSE